MDYQRNLSVARRIKFLIALFLFILQTGIKPASCAEPDAAANALNHTDASPVNITLHTLLGSPVLSVTCQGTDYKCDEVPKNEIQQHEIYVVMRSCAPSILRCLHQVYQPQVLIKYLEIHDMIGQGTDKDWSLMHSVSGVRFHLKDSDELPNEAINYLPNLSNLYIEGGNFTLPPNFHVVNKTALKHLALNKNGLNNLTANAFYEMPHLTSLLISNNQLEVVNIQAFRDLLELEEIELRNNDIKAIQLGTTNTGNNRLLKIFKLYNNSIAVLPNNFFQGYYVLEKILIRDNQIEMKLDPTVFSHLSPSIKLLQVSNCKIRDLPEFMFQGSSNLHNLNMKDNFIRTLHPNLFNSAFSIRGLTLSGNEIEQLPDSIFSMMKKMELLDLSHNKIERLNSRIFETNKKLRILSFNDNNIRELGNDLFKSKYFLSVSLAANKLRNIEGLSFKDNPTWETRELNLSLNYIEVFEDWFLRIKKLEYLDISSNKIKTLSSNQIEKRSEQLTINLKNNTIAQIVGHANSAYDTKTSEENILLYLAGNPFECDCLSTTILHEWNRRKIIGDFEDLTCVDGVKISTINVYLHCNEKHALIALIGTSLVGTLFGFIVLISIITRWNEIWGFISRNLLNKRFDDSTLLELSQDALKPYDLFISFAHQDEEFVTENLLPKLEFEYGLKVCVHYRDWVVGELIPDQIIQSVENARMTVIILTENFLSSDWSYLEFRTAHNLGLQEGKPRVILILLNESITKDERLSIDLKSYIAINSYVVWRDPYFWTKLEKRFAKGGQRMNLYEKCRFLLNNLKSLCMDWIIYDTIFAAFMVFYLMLLLL